MDQRFVPLPYTNEIDTKTFLESVSHLPPFFRGLRFIWILLQNLADGERDEDNPNLIRINITKAYDQAPKRYHGWIVQKVFKAALFAAPCRSDFLKALIKDQEVAEEDCLAKIRQFLINFTATVDAIYEMYSAMNAELDYLV
ncbi:glycolipid transfer -like protein [Labeo rohita]|uniref:Glycolipid transfer protein n=2 Tax=Labeo rohita TaxID=84645 RepID=A0ABQ8MAJ9_LABRO|nr:Glycolipid transfer protein [Labeo rohita]RXN23584.1 glycolipid transfer -like protein [Labeo rohita]